MKINEAVFIYDPRLQRVKKHVEQHLAGPLPAKTVAAVAGLEPKYFSTFFHRNVGVRYSQWLAWLRVQRATERIREANYPIMRVAFSVGFGSIRAFERAFKRHTSMTPRAYKRMVRPRPMAKDAGTDSDPR